MSIAFFSEPDEIEKELYNKLVEFNTFLLTNSLEDHTEYMDTYKKWQEVRANRFKKEWAKLGRYY